MTLDQKYKILYDKVNLDWLGHFTDSIFMTPDEFFQGLEISRLVVIPVKDGGGQPTIDVRSICIAHSETAVFLEPLPKDRKFRDDVVYAPLQFTTVDCDDSDSQTSKKAKFTSAPSAPSAPPPKCAFSRITNSDGVLQVGYLELFQAVQQMFLPRSLEQREAYARGNPHADDFRRVDTVIDVLNEAMDSGRDIFASKLKPHLEASRNPANPKEESRKEAILLAREISRVDCFYDAGSTIQEGRLSTMTLGGDPYYLENKALRNDEYFDKTVYNVLVTVKVVIGFNMYFIYFYISRLKILEFLRVKKRLSITEGGSISFWIGQAMEFINRPEFIAVIRDIITTSVEPEREGPPRSPSTQKVIDYLLPFLNTKVRDGAPADYHCSIDSGCKSFAFVEIKEGSSVIKNYTRLRVPDLNYLPNDFVVGRDDHNNPYVLTHPFTALGRHDWTGIVIGSNDSFQLPKYSNVRIASVIGEGEGDSMNFSQTAEASDSIREDLVDPVAAEAEAKAAEAAAVVAAEAKAAEAAAAAAEAAAETRVTHPPSLIYKTIDYVVGMINYFFTSPKIGRSSYDKTFIDGLLQNLPIGVSIHTLEEKQRYISTDNEIYQEAREALTGRGGRGCKLLKRTKKQKRGSRSRSRRSRRGSRRRRSRKN